MVKKKEETTEEVVVKKPVKLSPTCPNCEKEITTFVVAGGQTFCCDACATEKLGL